MTYEKVSSIKIQKDGRVLIKSASSNVFPTHYTEWYSEQLEHILRTEGKEGYDKELLYRYWQGTFQKTNNNYEKSLVLLDRNVYGWNSSHTVEEIKEVLYSNYLRFNARKIGRFVVQDVSRPQYRFISQITKGGIYYTSALNAKIFRSAEEALLYAKHIFTNDIKIMELL